MAEHATQAVTGRGTLVQRGGVADTDAFETISEVIGWTPPQVVTDEIEATHSESPDGFKEYIQGLKDGGECTVDVNWRPDIRTTHASLKADLASGELRYYRFVLPSSIETITFRGFVKGIARKGGPNAKLEATITWRVSRVS